MRKARAPGALKHAANTSSSPPVIEITARARAYFFGSLSIADGYSEFLRAKVMDAERLVDQLPIHRYVEKNQGDAKPDIMRIPGCGRMDSLSHQKPTKSPPKGRGPV